ncbi:MAG: zinc ABC transporter substrate-binding protein [Verrucomicrobia bacterium]|nr:zinc ABC transporter substrate-binding protein [Verrucomicrobiota bacterium]
MRRLICIVCLLFLGGCSDSVHTMGSDGKVRVLSTTAMIDDVVGAIGGERIFRQCLIIGQIDPHSYELVKGDDEKLLGAQIVFYNGLGLEHGASLRYQLERHPRAVGVGDQVMERYPDQILHVGRDVDPHLWMDLSLWAEIIEPIVDALSQVDPDGEALYRKNGEDLRVAMLQQHDAIKKQLQSVPASKRYLVTSHDAFNYFTRAYLADPDEPSWRARFDAPEGLAPDGQLGAADIQGIVDHLFQFDIHIVFPESNVSRDSLKKIVHACARKGLSVAIADRALYGDAIGPIGSGADSYFKMMDYNADLLVRAWEEK